MIVVLILVAPRSASVATCSNDVMPTVVSRHPLMIAVLILVASRSVSVATCSNGVMPTVVIRHPLPIVVMIRVASPNVVVACCSAALAVVVKRNVTHVSRRLIVALPHVTSASSFNDAATAATDPEYPVNTG
ncbi:MAG: hypothetical protein MK108_05275 [Mariniblastus sp.]|nr:hypothetical protein [Mariniblastus sp.]